MDIVGLEIAAELIVVLVVVVKLVAVVLGLVLRTMSQKEVVGEVEEVVEL